MWNPLGESVELPDLVSEPVARGLGEHDIDEARRFLEDWIKRRGKEVAEQLAKLFEEKLVSPELVAGPLIEVRVRSITASLVQELAKRMGLNVLTLPEPPREGEPLPIDIESFVAGEERSEDVVAVPVLLSALLCLSRWAGRWLAEETGVRELAAAPWAIWVRVVIQPCPRMDARLEPREVAKRVAVSLAKALLLAELAERLDKFFEKALRGEVRDPADVLEHLGISKWINASRAEELRSMFHLEGVVLGKRYGRVVADTVFDLLEQLRRG